MVDLPAPQTLEDRVEVKSLTPHEQVQQRTAEQIDDFPLVQMLEECLEVVSLTPHERVQHRTVESVCDQIVDVPVPRTPRNQRTDESGPLLYGGSFARPQAEGRGKKHQSGRPTDFGSYVCF